MKKIGLTGNIGSGKSTVAEIFSILRIPVYHADLESGKLLENPDIKDQIHNIFGPGVFTLKGMIDRKSLAGIVFADPEKLKTLNSILHPKVKKEFRNWVNRQVGSRYIILEAAIIFESGFRDEFDSIIHVSCPGDIAIERVIKRDHTDRNEIIKRLNFQMDDDSKAALSDFVIHNDGTEMLIPQVLKIHQTLLEDSAEEIG